MKRRDFLSSVAAVVAAPSWAVATPPAVKRFPVAVHPGEFHVGDTIIMPNGEKTTVDGIFYSGTTTKEVLAEISAQLDEIADLWGMNYE